MASAFDFLFEMEAQMNEQRKDVIFDSLVQKHMKEIYKLRKAQDNEGLLELQDKLDAQAYELFKKEEPFKRRKKLENLLLNRV